MNIHESVLRAMHVPGQNHRDPWFPEFYKKCLSDLKMIFGTTDGTTIIFPGTGTGGWESALTNTLSPGDRVVTFRYGLFSHLWIDMMQRLGLDVTVIEGRWGDGAYEDRLAEVLAADGEKKIKAVCVVHNETTTGVTSDIPEVRPAGGALGRQGRQQSRRAGGSVLPGGCPAAEPALPSCLFHGLHAAPPADPTCASSFPTLLPHQVRKTLDAANHPALLLVDGVSSIGALDFQVGSGSGEEGRGVQQRRGPSG